MDCPGRSTVERPAAARNDARSVLNERAVDAAAALGSAAAVVRRELHVLKQMVFRMLHKPMAISRKMMGKLSTGGNGESYL